MSPLAIGAIIGLVLTLTLYLLTAARAARKTSELREYFFSNWDLDTRAVGVTVFSSAMSLATVVIALLQFTIWFGLAISWATITFCAGWFVYFAASRTIRAQAQRRDTLHAFIGRRYGSRFLTVAASSITIAGLLGLFATELFAADVLLKALGLPDYLSVPTIIALGMLATIHASLGGFPSVIRSDRHQTYLLLLAIGVLTVLCLAYWTHAGSPRIWNSPKSTSLSLPVSIVISLFMINVPFPFVDTLAWQRALAARSEQELRRGGLLATAGFAVIWTVLIFLGIVLATCIPQGHDPFVSTVQHANTFGSIGAMICGALLFPGLFAALFSSSDAFLNSASHAFSLDLTAIRNLDDAAPVGTQARRYVVALGIAGLVVTLALRAAGFRIADMIFAVYAGTLALFPTVTIALLVKQADSLQKLRVAAIASAVAGFLAAWINGFYSLSSPESTLWLWRVLAQALPRDVYQSPGYAFGVSWVAFCVVALLTRFNSAPSRTAP